MKKILLSTTILAFSAGYAAAEVTMVGAASMDINYSDNSGTARNTSVNSDASVTFSGSFAADNGITMAAKVSDTFTGADVSLAGDFGTITFGTPTDASNSVAALGAGAIDANAENYISGTAHDARWDYTMDGITLAISGNSAGDEAAGSLKYTSGTLAIVVGTSTVTSNSTWNGISVGTTLGALDVKVMAATANGTSSSGIGATFDAETLGLGSVTLAFANQEGLDTSWAINMKKDLGGLTLNAEWVDAATQTAQVGITMGF